MLSDGNYEKDSQVFLFENKTMLKRHSKCYKVFFAENKETVWQDMYGIFEHNPIALLARGMIK